MELIYNSNSNTLTQVFEETLKGNYNPQHIYIYISRTISRYSLPWKFVHCSSFLYNYIEMVNRGTVVISDIDPNTNNNSGKNISVSPTGYDVSIKQLKLSSERRRTIIIGNEIMISFRILIQLFLPLFNIVLPCSNSTFFAHCFGPLLIVIG